MSVNMVILMGNVGKEPEVRTVGESKVATFTLATSDKGYKLSNGTEVPERTEWHNIVVWRGLAEVVEKYVHKGDKLHIIGNIRTRSYEQNGVTKYVAEIFVDQLEMLTYRTEQKGPVPQSNDLPW